MGFIQKNKEYTESVAPYAWRRLAIGGWKEPNNPTLYGILELNVKDAIAFVDEQKQKTGKRITLTHFAGKVIAQVLKDHPELNTQIRLGRFFKRKNIDLCFQVLKENPENIQHGLKGPDLSAAIIRSADLLSLDELADSLNDVADRIRKKNDPEFGGIKKISKVIPGFLHHFAVSALGFILNTLNLWSPALGVPRNAFGSALITNVGSLGLDFALPALFPPAQTPMIIAIGAVYSAPVYETDQNHVVTRIRMEPHLRLMGAFDHRYLDGGHASKIAAGLKRYFMNPRFFE